MAFLSFSAVLHQKLAKEGDVQMDTFRDFFNILLSLLLCVSPFILLIIVGGIIAFFVYHTRKRRTEKLQAALDGISGVSLPEINTVIESGPDPSAPLTGTLVDGAQLLQRLTTGDAVPLEKRALNQFIQALRIYKQRVAVGELPGDELTKLGQDDLQRIESLITAMTLLVDAAENGDAESLHQHLRDVNLMLVEAYEKHIDFCRKLDTYLIHEAYAYEKQNKVEHGLISDKLAKEGVKFPLPQSVQETTSRSYAQDAEQVSAQILQQLPEDKRMLFMMQYNSMRKNPTTAVLLAVFLGSFGAHKFYMGKVGWGIVYLLFCWTWIPGIVGLIEAFMISDQVHKYNAQKAFEIAEMLKSNSPDTNLPIQ